MRRYLITHGALCLDLWTSCGAVLHNIRRVLFIVLPYTALIIYCNIQYYNYGPDAKFAEMVRNLDFHDAYRMYTNNPLDPLLPKPINQARFSMILESSDSCKGKDIVIFVKTVRENYLLRRQIRETWGNVECYSKHGSTAHVMFVLGINANTQETELQQSIEIEQRKYKDILQFGFIDDYRNNTYKLMSILRYASEKCSTARFVIIFDEDFIVNPRNVVQTLNKVTHTHYHYYIGGYIMEGKMPIRNWADKWFLPTTRYPYVDFPRYPTGGSIFMSMEVARLLAFGLQYVPFLFIDDLLLGIALHHFGIAPVWIPGVHYKLNLARAEQHELRQLVSAHGFGNVEKQLRGWDRLLQPC